MNNASSTRYFAVSHLSQRPLRPRPVNDHRKVRISEHHLDVASNSPCLAERLPMARRLTGVMHNAWLCYKHAFIHATLVCCAVECTLPESYGVASWHHNGAMLGLPAFPYESVPDS